METAVLGGGCFWCLEAVFRRFEGVLSVTPGYAGGTAPNPTYEEVCGDATGHAEVVRVEFDSGKIAYKDVLDVFWKAHDPTTPNQQGADFGSQYRSIILYNDDSQREQAEKSLKKAQADWKSPIVTEVKPLSAFYAAESYHKDYYENNRTAGYCRLVIAPKLKKLGLR